LRPTAVSLFSFQRATKIQIKLKVSKSECQGDDYIPSEKKRTLNQLLPACQEKFLPL
jgi:hypothetical protein